MEVKLGPAEVGEGELKSFELAAERHVLVTRLGGALYAIDDLCNHAGCLLSGGWLEGANVVCPCHEYQFDVRTGENTTSIKLCEDQARFPVRVEAGELVVDLPEKAR